MNLDWDIFCDYIASMESYYDKQLPKEVKLAWYSQLRVLTEDQLELAIAKVYQNYEFMPRASKVLLEYANKSNTENWQAYRPFDVSSVPALPSSEILADSLNPEQRLANLQKIREMSDRILRFRNKPYWSSVGEIAEKSSKNPRMALLFEISKDLGSSDFGKVQSAISRAEKENFQVVYDEAKTPITIKEIDF